ncbi:formate dehydrogenase subunit delta [Ponticoccus sp. SC2-23]|uniref:formate dehydrogenase subunit delta n=1 Tax=Alexandriicola marinus TaxID=2081710 RepID=UPI000FDB4AE5|nr:formate dehydrogenase subunit delta [Alexandriicola marinus]MBM1221492.1 formate dehydrogenase subunit delta [Ponticoccus sp. SC6-9]MBM1226533.1 formate dehydrogenase subunit delta [Ponticoccus sp. SC6-15]MBM1230484.1 formate dehydrogenase subunit delta [Ponticoccus sp. SC6-38]MBM1235007.1 formate dehydrogenase subunit delta [Ponticoccus sp. SC6-45]MBM1239505.1 formate dehydrogenase subunit delta [Ponticoccus sp. SC6-49]MBM1243287.1 formate dehydrogenase subunit delta [Ponticoccus sp. SC2-
MSSDTDAKLVRMANQIAGFFDTQPGKDAVDATARHLVEFWDPRMRAQLATLVEQGGGGLSETAHRAAERLARMQDA